MVQNQNLIRVFQGRDAVGNDENRMCPFQILQLFLYVGFRFHINGGCGVIQNQDGRIL